MRTLEQSLQDDDVGRLRVIAELWGLDPPTGKGTHAAAGLVQGMRDPERAIEIFESLPASSQRALQALLAEGGKLRWVDFTQRFGALREMGPGRRDREKPWRDPVSDTERLLYHGFIARAFGDSPTGAQEFAYVPSELQTILPETGLVTSGELGHALGRPDQPTATSSGLVDDATTLLAALRQKPADDKLSPSRGRWLARFLVHPDSLPLLLVLLRQLGQLEEAQLTPDPLRVGPFLAQPRTEALALLTTAWRDSATWNDLALLEHLEPGPLGWPNDPQTSRTAALELISRIPIGTWWDLESFLGAVERLYPSFLRPGGDFESWYLRDQRTGTFLQGIEAWQAVEGSLLRALLTGPLHWLGAADLGAPEPAGHPDRIRLTPWAQILWDRQAAPEVEEPAAGGRVRPDGRLQIQRAAPRDLRYQLARLTTWLDFDGSTYSYRLRPSSVIAGAEQGLQVRHVQQLLAELSQEQLPPRLLQALERLEARGVEARLEQSALLQVSAAAMLDRLVEGRRTSGLILKRLGPRAALVRAGDVDKLLRVAAEAGLLIEPPGE